MGVGFCAVLTILAPMKEVLARNRFLIEEQSGLLKASFSYDVRDPDTGEILLRCREGELGRATKFFRFSEFKRTTPFDLRVFTRDERLVMRIVRDVPVFSSRVRVLDAEDGAIGGFHQKVMSLASVFTVVDAQNLPVCVLKGKPISGEFRLLASEGAVLARIKKQWAGMAKELLTSADHYMLEIDVAVPRDRTIRQLILASALCIGLVVKFELP